MLGQFIICYFEIESTYASNDAINVKCMLDLLLIIQENRSRDQHSEAPHQFFSEYLTNFISVLLLS